MKLTSEERGILEKARGVAVFVQKGGKAHLDHERLLKRGLLEYLDNWYDDREEAYTTSDAGREALSPSVGMEDKHG